MNSFTLTAVGNLARNPELVAKNDTSYARFCLVGNDYAGKDEEGAAREIVTTAMNTSTYASAGPLSLIRRCARLTSKGASIIVAWKRKASIASRCRQYR